MVLLVASRFVMSFGINGLCSHGRYRVDAAPQIGAFFAYRSQSAVGVRTSVSGGWFNGIAVAVINQTGVIYVGRQLFKLN